jgi:hypothetical protein
MKEHQVCQGIISSEEKLQAPGLYHQNPLHSVIIRASALFTQ